uniref:BED-type domain-containing protein n=1 Tax=Glycine max TaxID=3847 RepID=A0A0R0I8W9_SOYBN
MVDTLEDDRVVVNSDMKKDPVVVVGTDAQPDKDLAESEMLPGTDAELNKDLSNSETLPNKELPVINGEAVVALPNQCLGNSEEPMNGHHPENCELLTNNQPDNAEASRSSQTVDSKALPTNQSANSEDLSNSQLVSSEAPLDMKASQPSNQQVNTEALPNHINVSNSETHTSNDVLVSETQHSDEVVMSETVQGNEGIMYETQQSNEVVMSEMLPDSDALKTQTCNDWVMSEALPKNELANHTRNHNNLLSHSETGPDNQLTNLHMIPEDQLPQSESLPHSEPLPYSEPLTDTHLSDIKVMYHNHLSHYETLPNNHPNHSEALSLNQLSNYEALSHDQLADSQMLSHYELENTETMHHNQIDCVPETQPIKRRIKRSIVWEHFTIEAVSPECRRARCKRCAQTFAYSTGSKVAGTSHLKSHVAKGICSALLRNHDHNQLTPYIARTRASGAGDASATRKRQYRSPSTPYVIFDQDQGRNDIARMIIMHDYPLHIVEHLGFVAFVQNLQPQFKRETFNSIQGDCVATYLMEKQHLLKCIDGLHGRVCLTLDTWTSSLSLGYVFITGHFVDHDWKLQRRILNVVMEPFPDSDSALTHAVAVCLSDWGLEGSVAKDLLGSAQDLINKIHDSVKYVKTSELHAEKFLELKQHLQVPSEMSLFIDDQIHWNTSYQMLVAASELKTVFSCLDTSDPDYKGAPSMQDWKLVETLCSYLKLLFDAANILTTTTHPTTITFFHEVWKLQLDAARAIDEYWRECSLVLALAVVMDPRFKMKLVEFSFAKIYGEDAHFFIRIVDDGIHELFHEYVTNPLPLTLAYAENGSVGNHNMMEEFPGGAVLSDNGLKDFDAYIMETSSQQTKSELDQYLEKSLLPRVPDFDVLGWWKLNKIKYPTVSKMARDILSIPVSTVAPDSVFYSKSKEMDEYRSSLRPETVEALVCTKDWMQYETIAKLLMR